MRKLELKKKKIICSILITLIITFGLSYPQSFAQKKRKARPEIITVDLKKNYKILKMVSVRSGGTELENVDRELLKEAKKIGADFIIGVRYFSHQGYLYGYGTAVKLE